MCPFIARFRAVESHYHPLNHIFHAFGGMSCFFLLIMNRLGWNIWKMSILTVLKTQYYSKKYNRCHKIGWTHHPEFTNLIFRYKIISKNPPNFNAIILRQYAFWFNFQQICGDVLTSIAAEITVRFHWILLYWNHTVVRMALNCIQRLQIYVINFKKFALTVFS